MSCVGARKLKFTKKLQIFGNFLFSKEVIRLILCFIVSLCYHVVYGGRELFFFLNKHFLTQNMEGLYLLLFF